MADWKIEPSTFIMKFGICKNMLVVDVAGMQTVDKKGEYVNTGLKYLQWLVGQEWFKQVDIIRHPEGRVGTWKALAGAQPRFQHTKGVLPPPLSSHDLI